VLKLFTFFLSLILCASISAQREGYAIVKKNDVVDKDLLDDSLYTYTRVLIGGDILHEGQMHAAVMSKDSLSFKYNNWFKQIRPVLFIGDIVIGNLETTFGGKPYSSNKYYSAPDEYLSILKKSGFNVLLTANDKAADRDGSGLRRTLDMLDKSKIRHTGTFRTEQEREKDCPLMIKIKGINVAILNYTTQVKKNIHTSEIVNKMSLGVIKKDVLKAKEKNADYIIVYMHWGNENDPKVVDYQKSVAQTVLEYGADAIMGSHPHYFQPIVVRKYKTDTVEKEKIIAYSLGNFISAEDKPGLNGSAIIELLISKHKQTGAVALSDYGYIPIWTQIEKNNFTVLPITNIEEENVLQVKLNYKQYEAARNSIEAMRGIMYEKMDEVHYNLTDKIVDDVDETYVLQNDNPSLVKVAEDGTLMKPEDSAFKAQLAYLQFFGSPKEIEDLRASLRIPAKTSATKNDVIVNASNGNKSTSANVIPKEKINEVVSEVVPPKPIIQRTKIRQKEEMTLLSVKEAKPPKPFHLELLAPIQSYDELKTMSQGSNAETKNATTSPITIKPNITKAISNAKISYYRYLDGYKKEYLVNSPTSKIEDEIAIVAPKKEVVSIVEGVDPKKIELTKSSENSKTQSELDKESKSKFLKDLTTTEVDSKGKTILKSSDSIVSITKENNVTFDSFKIKAKLAEAKATAPLVKSKTPEQIKEEEERKSMRETFRGNTTFYRPTAAEVSTTSATQITTYTTDATGKRVPVLRKLELVETAQTKPLEYAPKKTSGVFSASEPTPVTQSKPLPTPIPKQFVEPVKVPDQIIFYIQVYSYNEKIALDIIKYPHLKFYEVVIEEFQYKYLIGKTKDLMQIAKQCAEVRLKGQPDAFIVKYVNGARVPFIGN
jgi:hypothetical protein